MSKKVFLAVLGLTLAVAHTAPAQMPPKLPFPYQANSPSELPLPTELPGSPIIQTSIQPHHPPVPDDWILNRKCEDCCGPLGGDGPIRTELYVQSGFSFPVGGGVLSNFLEPGWTIQGGARLMLFNPERDRAWAVDLSGSNTWNPSRHDPKFALSLLVPNNLGQVKRVNFGSGTVPGVTLRDFNQTFVNIGLGRDWYFGDPALSCGNKGHCNGGGCQEGCDWSWRLGFDGGGRYGTASAQFADIRERNDVIGGAYLGLHADVEIPCGCCVLLGGVRGEWTYTWSDIMQRKSDVQEINLLFTVGVRY